MRSSSTIKIAGQSYVLEVLKFDRTNWRAHRADWEDIFDACPDLRRVMTGQQAAEQVDESQESESNIEEDASVAAAAEIGDAESTRKWNAEAQRVHKQSYDQDWRRHLLHVVPPLTTVKERWQYIEKLCTGLQHSDREAVHARWNSFVQRSPGFKYPTKASNDGDRGLHLAERLSRVRSELQYYGVHKTDAEMVRTLISCFKMNKFMELQYLWMQEEIKLDAQLKYVEFVQILRRVYASKWTDEDEEPEVENPMALGANTPPRWNQGHDANAECGRCGLKHKEGDCRAMGKECHECGKKNHFARMCRAEGGKSGSGGTKSANFARSHIVCSAMAQRDDQPIRYEWVKTWSHYGRQDDERQTLACVRMRRHYGLVRDKPTRV